MLPQCLVCSYHTVSPLPHTYTAWRFTFCCTFHALLRTDVIRHFVLWSPDFPLYPVQWWPSLLYREYTLYSHFCKCVTRGLFFSHQFTIKSSRYKTKICSFILNRSIYSITFVQYYNIY